MDLTDHQWEAVGPTFLGPSQEIGRKGCLVTRYETKAENYLGLLQLACILTLLRQY